MEQEDRGSIFHNFHDMRGEKAVRAHDFVQEVAAKIPEGKRVVLAVSKSEFGKLRIPLDLMGSEVIS
jgi:hypothetical protein